VAAVFAEPALVTPRSLGEAFDLLSAEAYRPIAGGTDLMVQLNGEIGDPPERVLDLWRLDELRGITTERGSDGAEALVVGALTTFTEIRRSSPVGERLPALAEAAATIGAAQIQNRGTIGGNCMNASPASDTAPVLLAADAELILGSLGGERGVAAAAFWPAYRRTACRADELLVRIRIPLPLGRRMRFRKVGTRRAQAISKVVMALAYREDGGVWRDVRLALGSVAPTPIRARATEEVLEGAAPRATVAEHAAAVLQRELQPIDDVRSTADYRRSVSGRILHRILREEGGW
jgi:CO/xanthine dehydrogenase FAD-binding subunit